MNTFGRNFRVQLFGESHGDAIGVVIDGVKAGLPLSKEDFMEDILRRKSGAKGTTPRLESDEPEILSGVFEGHTTGAPIAVIFRNDNTRSVDYEALKDVPRPGHADYTALKKWQGFNDPRGGGHFSGRLTLPLVAAGVVAKKQCGFSFKADLIEIGGEEDKAKWPTLLDQTAKEGDSLGGIVECCVEGVPAGLGEPFFDSVESLISHAVFSIPGVRGIEFGDGFAASRMKGSEHNDALTVVASSGGSTASLCEGGTPAGENHATLGTVRGGTGAERSGASGGAERSEAFERPEVPSFALEMVKNGAGGVNGGITNGAPIVFRVAFKPTSSISKTQKTLNIKTGEMVDLNIKGRHDVCFALRTPVIVEAVAAIVLAGLNNQ
ncbi:MAG: chorismate synthase [Bacteroidales bacterium]|nr:chorismate synthase [Bacteroidales bacterium]